MRTAAVVPDHLAADGKDPCRSLDLDAERALFARGGGRIEDMKPVGLHCRTEQAYPAF